ncbi:MAG: hypothetical protein NTW64_04815 [Candidatus Omnitrophica bacterium]|nr:hypothetical protein [Candidatus Omnitrophota bacterium]
MNKEEALKDFVAGFRIAVYNGSAYSRTHPLYLKSLLNFKEKIDVLFNFLDCVKVNFTPRSLFIDGVVWDKLSSYIELGQLFHQRKIEGVEIKRGVTLEELTDFVNEVSKPKKEILRAGGVRDILKKKGILHILVDELNYAQLLEGEGEEALDIWVYKFRDASKKQDAARIKELSDNFGGIIGKFKAQSLLEDKELSQEICNFLNYLRDNQKEAFTRCSSDMFEWLLKYKELLKDENIDKVKPFFVNLNEEDLAGLLWNQILSNANFDTLSFKLFSQITGEVKHGKISSTLESKTAQKMLLKDHPEAVMRIQALLFAPGNEIVPDVYRNTLSSMLEGISFEKEFFFDHNFLNTCYHFVLAELLNKEKNEEPLSLIAKTISHEWSGIVGSMNLEYLKQLLEIVKLIKKEKPSYSFIFEELDRHISEYIESLVWEEDDQLDLKYFVDYLEKPSFKSDFYLAKIFEEKKAGPYALGLFLRFFPDTLPFFYQCLEQGKIDIEFTTKIIESLKILNSPMTLEILKNIFLFANEFEKVQVLRAMGGLSEIDAEFLFSILSKGDFALKEEALTVLAKDESKKKEAIRMLLSIPNFFGIENDLLMENIMIIENIRLKEASSYLVSFSKKRFFWNRDIKDKAMQVLKKWQT